MKLEEVFPLIYCVNLEERKDRWTEAKREFRKANIKAKHFSAIKDVPAFVGCWKSHLEILREAREKDENVFIFEDDAFIIGQEQIEDTIEELAQIEWDMFYLGGNILRPFFQVTKRLARLSHCQSTHAYGVNKKILDPLIKIVEANKTHIDVVYADIIVPNVKAFISIPLIATQRESYSDIEGRMMDYSIPIKRYCHHLVENRSLNV